MNGPPDDDSDDLTDEEVANALPTGKLEDLVPHLAPSTCGVCGKIIGVIKHEKRSKKPHMYWRVQLSCEGGHLTTKVFQTSWLRPEP